MSENQTATLGGGCFWCLEPVFSALEGVSDVMPGYAGGHRENPSYEQVCTGTTGHAEVVQVTFAPDKISYADLLEVFFAVHDPTTRNRQGADVGTQYRSLIAYHDEGQKEVAEEVLKSLERDPSWEGPRPVTEVVPFSRFYPAEDYHRNYFDRNPAGGYCRVVIAPKLKKFRKRFSGRLKEGL